MKEITVTYKTQVPADMTEAEILEWLIYTLTERGIISDDNPMRGCGPEPHEGSISFKS